MTWLTPIRLPVSRSLLVGIGMLGVMGCEVDVHDGLGPREPDPNVIGVVLRAGDPAKGLEVDLRTTPDATTTAVSVTDGAGQYCFADVAPGYWEVKVSGNEAEDFHSVSQEFTLAESNAKAFLAELDVSAAGGHLLAPPEGASHPVPTIFAPLTFTWALPEREIIWARVQIYDQGGDAVWFSDKESASDALWIGRGSEGAYDGTAVPAGHYTWRVKLVMADSSEARFDRQEIILE